MSLVSKGSFMTEDVHRLSRVANEFFLIIFMWCFIFWLDRSRVLKYNYVLLKKKPKPAEGRNTRSLKAEAASAQSHSQMLESSGKDHGCGPGRCGSVDCQPACEPSFIRDDLTHSDQAVEYATLIG